MNLCTKASEVEDYVKERGMSESGSRCMPMLIIITAGPGPQVRELHKANTKAVYGMVRFLYEQDYQATDSIEDVRDATALGAYLQLFKAAR